MAYNPDGKFTKIVVLGIRQGLGWGNNDAFSRMDAERVEILHVADGNAVVIFVTDNLVLYLFPAFQGFLHKDLRREGERLAAGFL